MSIAAVTLNPQSAEAMQAPVELSCFNYLLEKITQVWERICALFAWLFSSEAPTLPNFPKPLPQTLVVQKILSFCEPKENVAVGQVNRFFYQAYKKWLHRIGTDERDGDDLTLLKFYEKAAGKMAPPGSFLCIEALLGGCQLTPLDLIQCSQRLHKAQYAYYHDDLEARKRFAYPHPLLRDLSLRFSHKIDSLPHRKPFIEQLVQNCPEVRKLHLGWATQYEIDFIIKKLAKLEEVYLIGPQLESSSLNQCSTLKGITVRIFGEHQDIPHLFSIEKLRRLEVWHPWADNNEMTDAAFSQLAGQPSLQELEFNTCKALTLQNVLHTLPQLHTLKIEGCENVGQDAFASLTRAPKLRLLDLVVVKLEDVIGHLPGYPHLEELRLTYCTFKSQDRGTMRALEAIGRCAGLKSFAWTGELGWGEQPLFAALAKCKQLTCLEFAGCGSAGKSSADALLKLIEALPKLQEVKIKTSFYPIDIEAIRSLTSKRASPFFLYQG